MNSPVTTGDGGPLKVWETALSSLDPDMIMESACDKVAEEGWSLRKVAHHFRYPARLFIAWVEADERRLDMYRVALKIAAEYHVDKVKDLTETATMEDYQLKRFQSENHKWVASKYDRQRFGDEKTPGTVNIGNGAGTITISFVDAEEGRPKGQVIDG